MIADTVTGLSTTFLWADITENCNLECVHCFAKSGPHGTHGTMTIEAWLSVIGQFAALPFDGLPSDSEGSRRTIQFIGGEPTRHPQLPLLLRRALDCGLDVEVFSNLVTVPNAVWDVLALPGVSLATSYYSGDALEHERITRRRGSHARTTGNIAEAVRRGIQLRTAVIQLTDDQDVEGAFDLLAQAGIARQDIGLDRVRQVGRAVRDDDAGMEQLCGQCGHGNAAVLSDGRVVPCVFSRDMTVGNVLDTPLAEILTGAVFARTRATLRDFFLMNRLPVVKANCVPAGSCQPINQAPPRD